ncbi:MAG: glutamine synthetase [Rhizobiales bacterium]|nr:glutamine synthetase [Hyphomicrobiales bacterium]
MEHQSEQPGAEARAFLAAHPEVTHIDTFIIELCGRAIGKRMPRADLVGFFEKGSALCAATYLLDVRGNTADPLGHGFSDGDPDADAWPVAGTLRPVPWAGPARAQCMMRLTEPGTRRPVWFEPQHILERVVARFDELGLQPVVAVELEFFLIDPRRDEAGAPLLPVSPRTGQRVSTGSVYGIDVLDEFAAPLAAIEAAARAQAIPVTSMISEYGAGQFEINLAHVADPLGACDHAALLRRAVTEAARATGFDATFMSKPFLDQSGSGLQIHLSVIDADGRNIFDPSRPDGNRRLASAIAGMQATLAEGMAIFAPNLNAFRRFAPNQFTPVTRDWGENNRSMAFRIPTSDGANRRIEHRAGGADANPYLVMAAVLAGVHHGLANNLEPTPQATGNAGAVADPTLPLTLWSALDAFERSVVLAEYLGSRYIEAYATVKRAEFASFMADIHPREWQWYL